MSKSNKKTDMSLFPVDLMDLGDADLMECHRLFFNRYTGGEKTYSEIGEFAHALLVEMKHRKLERE